MLARIAILGAWLTSVSCDGEPRLDTPTPGTDPQPSTDTATPTEPLAIADLAGRWRGSIGEDYQAGCLCLTLDVEGNVIGPSGITLGFPVTTAGDLPDTTILDPEARLIRVHMRVSGSGFRIDDATVGASAETIDGDWLGDTPSAFDGTISLDREPETCMERTGLGGAPC